MQIIFDVPRQIAAMLAKFSFRSRAAVAKKHLEAYLGLSRTTDYFGAGEILEPEADTVLVLAPHMDDEVLGCGGTIARHIQAGAVVSTLFLTNGRHKISLDPGLTETERKLQERDFIKTRRDEAKQAAAILGVRELAFFDAEAGHLASSDNVVEQLRSHLNATRPAIVYLPFFLDRHPDHRAVSELLLAAADDEFECRGYEVWNPLFANTLVTIDATLETKKRALSCYRSQLAHTDFLHIGIALNAYRSSAVPYPGCRYAEAFCSLSIHEYRNLYETWKHSLR